MKQSFIDSYTSRGLSFLVVITLHETLFHLFLPPRLEKPSLEAIWSEQILVPPIRPKQFPHTAIPSRTRSSQIVSQSMMAMYDGLSSHLYNHVCESLGFLVAAVLRCDAAIISKILHIELIFFGIGYRIL